MNLPYYVPYNISDHVKPLVLLGGTTGRAYSAVAIDFDDNAGVQNYTRNLDRIEYVCTTTGTHTARLTANYPGGVDVQFITFKIYDNFEPYDSKTFFDYISATRNDYSLPNDISNFAQSNDWVTADNINAAFKAVYDNLVYLEGLCHRPDIRGKESIISWLGNSDLHWEPYDFGVLGTGGSDFISTNTNQIVELTNQQLNYLSAVGFTNIVDIAVKDTGSGNTLYLIDGTNVVVLSADSNATVLLSSGNVQFNKTFISPNSIDIDSLENIYVADSSNNEVYKFRAINGTLLLQTSVGGIGLSGDKYRLTAPNHVRIDSQDRVIVSDKNNYAIKIYDSLLSWIRTIDLTTAHGKALAVAVDKRDDVIYVVTELKYLKKYSKNGTLLSTVFLNSVGPNIVQCFIEFNGNYFYVVTPGTAYKYTRDGLFLKVLSVPESNAQAANDIMTGRSDEHNQTFIGTRTKIFRIDGTPPLLNIRPFTQDQYFTFDEIKIDPKEAVEDWIYNKSLFRLVHNHIVFARNIYATYIRGVNTANILESFTLGSRDFTQALNFEMSPDYYIGMNEPVLVNTINRALGKFFEFQNKALDAIAPQINSLFTIIPSFDTDVIFIPTPTPTPTSSNATPTPTPTITVTPPAFTYITFFCQSLGVTSGNGHVEVLCPAISFNSFTPVPYGNAIAIPPGSPVTIKAVPDGGFDFDKWSLHTQYLDGNDYTQATQTLTQPNVSIALVAEFV